MMQSLGFGPRRALATAIVVAFAGTAVAVEPSLRLLSTAGDVAVDLATVRFEPGNQRLVATSLAGNYLCGNAAEPTAGMQLELDGRRYAVKPSAGTDTIVYQPGLARFSLELDGIPASDCRSTNLTKLDLVVYGSTGAPTARSRIAQTVRMHVAGGESATSAVEVVLADPMHCETFGENSALDAMLTYANGAGAVLFGVHRFELMPEINGRRELRAFPETGGLQLLQCTSPGLAMGPAGGAGATPGRVFVSGYELSEGLADVLVTVSGDTVTGSKVSFKDSDDAFVTLTVENIGRAQASGVQVREYLRRSAGAIHVLAGAEGVQCEPIPADASPSPCPALATEQAFPLSFGPMSLAPGQGVRMRLHRTLAERGTDPEAKVEVGYAAFVDPSPLANDTALGNNSQWVNFAVS